MDEDMADEAASGAQGDPAAAASGAAVVETLPREFGASGTVTRTIAHVEIGFDREKLQFTAVRAGEGAVRGSEQVDLVLLVHLGNSPVGVGVDEGLLVDTPDPFDVPT